MENSHEHSLQPEEKKTYGLRAGAEEFPLMVIISIIYPCNMGCPNCPYTDSNSEIRRYYKQHDGDLMPVELWKKIADESVGWSAGDYLRPSNPHL